MFKNPKAVDQKMAWKSYDDDDDDDHDRRIKPSVRYFLTEI